MKTTKPLSKNIQTNLLGDYNQIKQRQVKTILRLRRYRWILLKNKIQMKRTNPQGQLKKYQKHQILKKRMIKSCRTSKFLIQIMIKRGSRKHHRTDTVRVVCLMRWQEKLDFQVQNHNKWLIILNKADLLAILLQKENKFQDKRIKDKTVVKLILQNRKEETNRSNREVTI